MLRSWSGKLVLVILARARLLTMMVATIALSACSHGQAPQAPDPLTVLETIPAAESSQYDQIRDMRKWPNPYLIVRTDGVAIFDPSDSAEILLKTDNMLPALAKLPTSNWPYGRVVAVAEGGIRSSEQDGIAIRRNKGIIGGMLQSAHITIKWVPSTN